MIEDNYMADPIFDKILGADWQLKALPQTISEVMRLSRDENASADQIAAVLLKDPALTTKVLKMVNSPFYGAARQIASMNQAVMTLGLRQVIALALSTSVYSMTSGWECAFDLVRFWRHSLEVAIAARMIAERLNFNQCDEVFVAGLLHDIGFLVLERALPDEFPSLWKRAQTSRDICRLEQQKWGINHAQIGEKLLTAWNLPPAICKAVGLHHTLMLSDDTNPNLRPSQIICLAHLLSRFAVSSEKIGKASGLVHKEMLRKNLKLSARGLHAIEKELCTRTLTEAAYLEIDIGPIDEILREANLILFDQYSGAKEQVKEIKELQHKFETNRTK